MAWREKDFRHVHTWKSVKVIDGDAGHGVKDNPSRDPAKPTAQENRASTTRGGHVQTCLVSSTTSRIGFWEPAMISRYVHMC